MEVHRFDAFGDRERVPEVALAPAEKRCVRREDDRRVAGVVRALDQGLAHRAVRVVVELEPLGAVGRRRRDVFHRRR